MNDEIIALTVKQFLSKGKYCIPIYQRNYDWGESEALQLLEDVADYALRRKENKYYIGSVVVYIRSKNGEDYFETIDGQQRLTTLTIVMNALKSLDDKELNDKMEWFKKANISYDHRPEADDAISNLSNRDRTSDHTAAVNIYDVYNIIKDKIRGILFDKQLTLSAFVDYLLNSVIIMRVPVPRDTELNHYFEIMNSRGEQLEKHEVLKANLMSTLDNDGLAMQLFNDLWEACSDMTKYVQMGMSTKLRDIIFTKEWDKLDSNDFDRLLEKYPHKENTNPLEEGTNDYNCCTLEKLFEDAKNNIKYNLPDDDRRPEGENERFGSVINFSNFLLQTLKVMYRDESEYQEKINKSIKLDDKQLIGIFQQVLNQYEGEERKNFSKRFIMALLRMRFLFDKYVIKRETYNNHEGWSLKSLKKYDKSKVNYVVTFPQKKIEDGKEDVEEENDVGKDILMLEAMFHVSAPTQIYKHWLNAILYYLNKKKEINPNVIDPTDMRRYLYRLACTYMRDQYMTDNTVDFETIIYKNESFPQHKDYDIKKFINDGCNVKNFIFNFYDYVVWKKEYPKYKDFEFTYRTSVEHFYPQTPQRGYNALPLQYLNSFGNLCLISRGMNSKFSNNMPEAKAKNFGNDEMTKELSIKLNEMMMIVSVKNTWGEVEIKEFEDKALALLSEALNKVDIEDKEEYNINQS